MSENQNFEKYYEELNKKFKEEEERQNKLMMEMKTSDNYINWLEKFTLKHPIFYNYSGDRDISNFTDLDDYDIENINKLEIFFDMIDAYAKENYIYLNEDKDYNTKYYIKHNNVYYTIGYDSIYSPVFRLERIPNEKNIGITAIEFKDIQTNTPQPKTDVIKIRLYSLANIMYEYSKSVPLVALKEIVYNTLQNIENDQIDTKTIKIKKKGTK